MLFATPLVTKWFCHFLDSGRNISLPAGHAHPCQPILRCLSCLAVWTDKFTTWLATLLSLSFSLAGSLLQFTVIPVQWLFFSRLAPVSRHSAFYQPVEKLTSQGIIGKLNSRLIFLRRLS